MTQTCPEHKYQGFNQAFNAGYRLYKLNERIHYAATEISNTNSQRYNIKVNIDRVEKNWAPKT